MALVVRPKGSPRYWANAALRLLERTCHCLPSASCLGPVAGLWVLLNLPHGPLGCQSDLLPETRCFYPFHILVPGWPHGIVPSGLPLPVWGLSEVELGENNGRMLLWVR
jgi:hypothetical protein